MIWKCACASCVWSQLQAEKCALQASGGPAAVIPKYEQHAEPHKDLSCERDARIHASGFNRRQKSAWSATMHPLAMHPRAINLKALDLSRDKQHAEKCRRHS